MSVDQLAATAEQAIEGFPLSPQQRRLWRLGLAAAGGQDAFAAHAAILIRGPLDAERLRTAVLRVVERHEILRTTFSCLPGMELPLQRIAAPGELAPSWLPASGLLPASPAASAAGLAPAQGSETARLVERLLGGWAEHLARLGPAVTDDGSPLRLCLVPLAAVAPAGHLLLVALPALSADAASLALLAGEIERAYAAVAGAPGPGTTPGVSGPAAAPPACTALPEAAPDEDELPPMQYADFAAWQDDVLAGPQVRLEAEPWARIEDLPELLAPVFPGRPRGGGKAAAFVPAVQPVLAATAHAAEIAAAVTALARRQGVTVEAVLLACWQVALARRGGPARFAIGVRRAGRDFAELAGLLGPVASYVPVIRALGESETLASLLQETAAALAQAGERHDIFSWAELARQLDRREEDIYPAWAFAFDSPAAPDAPAAPAAGGAPATRFSLAGHRVIAERCHLELACAAGDGCDLRLEIRFDAGRIAPAVATDLAAGLLTLLAALAAPASAAASVTTAACAAAGAAMAPVTSGATAASAAPVAATAPVPPAATAASTAPTAATASDAPGVAVAAAAPGARSPALARQAPIEESPVGELPVLTAAERGALLASAPQVPLAGAESCLHRLVAAQAALTPGLIAVRDAAASLTYAELERRALVLAGRLAALGAGPERRVAVFLERSIEMVVALLAILETGAAYVPLDPDHPDARLAATLADTAPTLLVSRSALLGRLPVASRRTATGSAAAGLATAPGAAGFRSPASSAVLCLDDGGEEAGAETGAAAQGLAAAGALTPRPLSAAGPENLAYVIYTSGSTGRPKGVMVPHRAIVNRLLWMQRRFPLAPGDRVLQKTPYTFDASIWEIFSPLLAGAELVLARPQGHQDTAYLAEAVRDHGITTLQLVPSLLGQFLDEPGVAAAAATLARLFCGGEELTPALAGRCSTLLGAELCNLYGPTEAAIDASFWACPRGPAPAAVPIGRPLPNVELVLVNSRLEAVPPGVAGELLIGGIGLARGYLGRPDLTAERFVPHPWSAVPGARLYRTGDLARRPAGEPDGELTYLGRIDRQVKVRGVRIELREIEALLATHPGVRQAAVVVRGDGADRRLVAYVTGPLAEQHGAPAAPQAAALRAWLAGRLPAAMLPGAVVALPALPLTPAGKLDLQALPDPAAAARRDGGDSATPADDAPRTPSEQLLAAIWAEVLGREHVGTGESFFALGGHSLAATRVMSRLRKTFGVELRVQSLFAAPTVAALAREIDVARLAGHGLSAPPLVRRAADDELPLSFAQQRLWFLEQLRPGTALYNIADAVRFRGALDRAALAAALHAVVRRHEGLRTTFPSARGTPRQRIHAPAAPPAPALPLVDLGALPEARRAAEAELLLGGQRDMPFDLARWPLLRALLVRMDRDEHLAAFTVHHIATDAWSSGILLRELAALYRAAAAGRPSPLPELPLQYADFALWQRRWLQGNALETQLAYWRRQLAGAPPLMALPTDRPRPALPSFAGATRPVLLPAVLADGLRALSRRRGATLFMTLLAAWSVLLRRQLPAAERDDVVMGTDIANRNRAESEGLIGFFINQLAVRTDLSGDPGFGDLLARVRATLLDAYAHQDVPFDLVVDALGLPRSLHHHPVFQVKLFLENTPASAFTLPGLEITALEVEVRVAKLDLTLAFWERPEGLSGWLNWSTDLFDAAPMARLARHLTTLATAIVERPDASLSELDALLADLAIEERTMERRELRDVGFKKWKAIQPKTVALPETDVVERTTLAPGATLPLVIRPLVADLDLADWATANAATIESDLLRHGAILFRGFGIDSPDAFEGFARTLCPDLYNENGEHPRESVSGNVYTPVFYPPDQRLLWHNENSFNWSWPRKIFFCCAQPAEQGGETPIVDSRRVYAEVDQELRERFAQRGVLYQRNYAEGVGLPWQTVFQAETREEVERQCLGSRVKVDWREGGRLRTRAVRPAVARHPESGELTWFNQAQHWHVSCLDAPTRRSLEALFADADLPRQCYYGDGEPIADQDMAAVLAVYERLEVSFPWQRGDVLLLDNLLTAHGRNPFKGQRKILVAMGQMTDFGEA